MIVSKVYFVAAPGRIKIGFTRHPEKRLVALQRSDMEDLTVIAIIDGNRALESMLHKVLKDYRLRWEWFRDCDEVREVIADAVAGKYVVEVPTPPPPRLPYVVPTLEPVMSPEFEIICRLSDEAEASIERGDDKYEIRGRTRAFLAASEVFIRQRNERQEKADAILGKIDELRQLGGPYRPLAGK